MSGADAWERKPSDGEGEEAWSARLVAEHVQGDTAVVKTGNPLQPFRVVLASKAAPGRTVSRVVTCNDDEPDNQ